MLWVRKCLTDGHFVSRDLFILLYLNQMGVTSEMTVRKVDRSYSMDKLWLFFYYTVCLQQKVLSNSMRSHKWHHKILWVTLFDIGVQYCSKITPHCSLFVKHIRSIWVNRTTSHNFMCFRAGLRQICQHNLKHNRWAHYASIIGGHIMPA